MDSEAGGRRESPHGTEGRPRGDRCSPAHERRKGYQRNERSALPSVHSYDGYGDVEPTMMGGVQAFSASRVSRTR